MLWSDRKTEMGAIAAMEHPFSLDLHTIEVSDVRFGPETRIDEGVMTVDAVAIEALLLEDPQIAGVAIEIARPGESVRIVHCLDAVEPRVKVAGEGGVFPGLVGPMRQVGIGETVRLAGVAVLTSSHFPQPASGLMQAREGVVDMSGPAAPYSPFSRVTNLVLVPTPNPETSNEDYDDAIRRGALRVAEHLARACAGANRSSTTTFTSGTRHPDLPKVVYFLQLQGQAPMSDTFLYGQVIHNLVPTPILPGEIMDGAIVNGVYVYACYKNPTYLHQNNPIIWDLQHRHGVDLDFAGVIINRGHNYTHEEKERSSLWAAKLARTMGADGAILTGEGGGNSAIDMMLACQYMEQAGIETVVLSSEATGEDGYDFPLFYSVPEADAIVSVGSHDGFVAMPEVERVIGDEFLKEDGVLLAAGVPARGPFDLRMYYQYCGINQLGANVIAGRAF